MKVASAKALEARLSRVELGIINSAEDEFISNRIPFQIGGMSDPFSLLDNRFSKTIEVLEIFRKFNYPIIISTKSQSIKKPEILAVLKDCNVYVRFSTTMIRESLRLKIDKGTSSYDETCETAEELTKLKVPVSFRFQPIIMGHEIEADRMIRKAANAGVVHISAEYLKVPIDANKNFGTDLKRLMENQPVQHYIRNGATRHGREYVLPIEYRRPKLARMKKTVNHYGMTFGYADNDLILFSDGSSCCGAADLYLKDASFFSANFPGVLKDKQKGQLIFFKDLLQKWIPQRNIETYLNSRARLGYQCVGQRPWESHLRKMWLGLHGLYAPSYFHGVEKTNNVDSEGMPIYIKT
ncbi:hypothetical protein BM526_00565 [Alteromonas mediterranea]|nr:hypothetical protein BM526_00565 [Alteromonas mediterranea]